MAASTTRETRPARATRQAAIVYNPIKVDADQLRHAVAAAESRAGWRKSLWLETSEEDPGAGHARRAVAAGVDVVLAAGGDGTVRAVAEGLRGSDVALALLPAGTGNLLARNLHMILTHLADSVDLAFSGDDRRIDMGVVELDRADGSTEEHSFLVMAGFGLDAKMIANAKPELKRRLGWIAYVDAIARALTDTERVRMRVRVDDDGEERPASVHTLIAGNCGALPGNVLLLPDAEIDDGLFDIVTFRPEGFFGWAQIWAKITWENGILRRSSVGQKLRSRDRQIRALRYYRARRLDVTLERAEEFELDGDPFGEVVGFRLRVDHGSLIVRVPRAG